MKTQKFTQLNKPLYYFLGLLVTWFVISPFLSAFLNSFWLIHWYEPVILLVFSVILVRAFIQKKLITRTNLIIGSVLLLSAISILIFSSSISRGVEGLRFTFFPLMLFFIAANTNFDESKKSKLVNIYLYSSIIIAIWAVIERFFPLKYWEVWGLLPQNSGFGYGWFAASDRFFQSASLIGAPNQLASFLLPSFFFVLSKIGTNLRKFSTDYILLTTITAAIILTASRSAYIGLLVGFLIYLYFINKNKFMKFGFSGVFSVSAIVLVFFYQTNVHFRTFSTHSNQTGHQYALSVTMEELRNRLTDKPLQFFLGSGLGSAGPLAIKYGDGIISESWYLQLFLEVGLVGLLLWLIFIVILSKELINKKQLGMFLSLVAVSTTAIFLHTWADNPALSFAFMILISLFIDVQPKKTY